MRRNDWARSPECARSAARPAMNSRSGSVEHITAPPMVPGTNGPGGRAPAWIRSRSLGSFEKTRARARPKLRVILTRICLCFSETARGNGSRWSADSQPARVFGPPSTCGVFCDWGYLKRSKFPFDSLGIDPRGQPMGQFHVILVMARTCRPTNLQRVPIIVVRSPNV